LLAAALTDIPGSSAVFGRGYVTYANEAKSDMLGVPEALIAAQGAVSRDVAMAMAEGALEKSRATIAIAITGIAGPDGGSPEKPVGLVWFGVAVKGKSTIADAKNFNGDRAEIRAAAVDHALTCLLHEAGLDKTSAFV
jgi:nicotinamide-nucleotide amidase